MIEFSDNDNFFNFKYFSGNFGNYLPNFFCEFLQIQMNFLDIKYIKGEFFSSVNFSKIKKRRFFSNYARNLP